MCISGKKVKEIASVPVSVSSHCRRREMSVRSPAFAALANTRFEEQKDDVKWPAASQLSPCRSWQSPKLGRR